MGSEAGSTPKLPLFSAPPTLSPEPSGMLTPPLQTSASVPFHWEEEPGKPRPCTALIALPIPTNKCLELQLPPRLQQMDYSKMITKSPSPTAVFDGPYAAKTAFSSSSSRFGSKRQDSFDCRSSERFQIGAVLLEKRPSGRRGSGFFGSWAQKAQRPKKTPELEGSEKEAGEGDGGKVKMARIRRNGSFLSISRARSRSNFWATMLEGLKQLVPWKDRKSKKQVLIN